MRFIQTIVLMVVVVTLIGCAQGDDGPEGPGENETQTIASFEECVEAGNPVMESYPPQCKTDDGEIFVKNVTEDTKHHCTPEEKQADVCTKEYAPVCGDNDQTYSNGCVACSSGEIEWYIQGACDKQKEPEDNASEDTSHLCTPAEKQADACTMQYDPVCGNNGETYSNGCVACSSGEIESYNPGACDEEKYDWHECSQKEKQADMCTMQHDPVCGDNDKTYSNGCVACSSGEIDAYRQGSCEAE